MPGTIRKGKRMAGTSEAPPLPEGNSDDKLVKLAVAISLIRSKLTEKQPQPPQPQPPPPAEPEALRWKRKAKERKLELLRLREDLKEAEDALRSHSMPEVASCKCYFFDDLGKLSPNRGRDGSDHRYSDVLRRRFLKQVRYKDRMGVVRDGSKNRRSLTELRSDDEIEQLSAAADFLMDLCDSVSSVQDNAFANWSHQAVDFILGSLKSLLSRGEISETVEDTINNMILRLVRKLISIPREGEPQDIDSDVQFYIQHLIRKLASEIYVGQRSVLAVSQNISVVAERLLFSKPFDNNFAHMHGSMYILIQLVELLVSDYLLSWSSTEKFDKILFEECLTSIVHARKSLELLDNRNGLYVLYLDRIIGELTKQLGQISSVHQLNPNILQKLFH